jgi:hypothetical protein
MATCRGSTGEGGRARREQSRAEQSRAEQSREGLRGTQREGGQAAPRSCLLLWAACEWCRSATGPP